MKLWRQLRSRTLRGKSGVYNNKRQQLPLRLQIPGLGRVRERRKGGKEERVGGGGSGI